MATVSKLFTTEDIDGLFRRVDFSAANIGFKSQLRNCLQSYSEELEECELTGEELSTLAAAKADFLPKFLRKTEC